jgi:ATP synthase protein I
MTREGQGVPPVGPSAEQDAHDNRDVRTIYRQDQWDVEQDNNIVPLTRAEAEKLFGPDVSRPSRVTPLKVVVAQMVLSLVVTLVWWLFDRQGPVALSALLGGAICWIPSCLFALGLKSVKRPTLMTLIGGAAIKTGITVALFIALAWTYHDVRWIPLLVTYLVALKTYWVAMAVK